MPRKSLNPQHSFAKQVVYAIKANALSRDIPWNLTTAEVLCFIEQSCFWCGDVNAAYRCKTFKLKGFVGYNGLDRLDSSLGYVNENVVACCKICNRMKRHESEIAFIERCRKIVLRHLPNVQL